MSGQSSLQALKSQVFFYLILGLVPLVSAEQHHHFHILGNNSTHTQFRCNYTDLSKRVYFDVYQNDRQCIHAADGSCAHTSDKFCICADKVEENQVIFTVRTPKCGEKLIITCKAINGVRSEKVIDITPKVSQPKLIINEGKEVSVHEPISVSCYTDIMCIGEELDVLNHHDYHISERTVVYVPMEENTRYSANLTTSLVFLNRGGYNVTCRTSLNKRTATKTVHVVPRINDPKSEKQLLAESCQSGARSMRCEVWILIALISGLGRGVF